jgi:hypothetical protein
MKFNVGVLTSESFTVAHIIVFENGIVLRSPPVEWLGIDEQKKVADDFEDIVNDMKNGTLQFDESFNPTPA